MAKNSLNVTQHNVPSWAVKASRPDHLGDGVLGAASQKAAVQNPLEKVRSLDTKHVLQALLIGVCPLSLH